SATTEGQEVYGDLSDVPSQRLKEVKGVIKSIRDLWRSGRVGSVSHLREWIDTLQRLSGLSRQGLPAAFRLEESLNRWLPAPVTTLEVCDLVSEQSQTVAMTASDTTLPLKPGLVKASNSFEDVLSTDVGSSDHEAPVSKSDKKERLRSGSKSTATGQTAQAQPPKPSKKAARKQRTSPKEISVLRTALRAKGNEVMHEVAAQQSNNKAKGRKATANRSAGRAPPGLEHSQAEAAPGPGGGQAGPSPSQWLQAGQALQAAKTVPMLNTTDVMAVGEQILALGTTLQRMQAVIEGQNMALGHVAPPVPLPTREPFAKTEKHDVSESRKDCEEDLRAVAWLRL
ncbi:unnamed protein product, partial [Symbiodinium necroappetens]